MKTISLELAKKIAERYEKIKIFPPKSDGFHLVEESEYLGVFFYSPEETKLGIKTAKWWYAYTADELLDLLPDGIRITKVLKTQGWPGDYEVVWERPFTGDFSVCEEKRGNFEVVYGDTAAEALGLLLFERVSDRELIIIKTLSEEKK